MDYSVVAKKILEKVGGEKNVVSVLGGNYDARRCAVFFGAKHGRNYNKYGTAAHLTVA